MFIEISYLLTDYLGFGYTISTYHKEICSNFYSSSFLFEKLFVKKKMILRKILDNSDIIENDKNNNLKFDDIHEKDEYYRGNYDEIIFEKEKYKIEACRNEAYTE